jgi:hypothetical protein
MCEKFKLFWDDYNSSELCFKKPSADQIVGTPAVIRRESFVRTLQVTYTLISSSYNNHYHRCIVYYIFLKLFKYFYYSAF